MKTFIGVFALFLLDYIIIPTLASLLLFSAVAFILPAVWAIPVVNVVISGVLLRFFLELANYIMESIRG